ncbi:unnamed protein product [Phyllotreta striolata]|uniref:Generative cell specific-1/HAP2 domain-containing protein n=1 Tax=Phyllotreta striolata TaxID=444603 RepID=A0A9N9TU41_PHYSR|nr:unnamed protein product [Phyllotreta striolata]
MKILLAFLPLFMPLCSQPDPYSVEDEKNLQCCARRAACCKTYPTDFEIKAVLSKCSKVDKTADKKRTPMTVVRTLRSPDSDDSERKKAGESTPGIANCKRKLKLTVKMRNAGVTDTKSQYVLVDHVFDSVTQQKQKLFNPYVLKITQEPVLAVYGLCYDGVVNAQAKELVVNKNQAGYTGCRSDSPNNPVCGSVSYRSETVPYSNGFCCSCNKDKDSVHFLNFSNLPYSYKFEKIPSYEKNYAENHLTPSLKSMHNNSTYSNNEQSSENRNIENDTSQARPHKRGGQNCNDKYTPANIINPDDYHSSSHCLQFSDLWYFVYRIRKPKVHHSVAVRIFEKYQTLEGVCKWRDLTKKTPVTVGTDFENFANEDSTLSVGYDRKPLPDNTFTLNYQLHKILVPDVLNVDEVIPHPEIKGGPGEYLVVKSAQVQQNGKTCNVAGVGYEAFAKQANRCSNPRGTCLKNQPIHMWEEDHDLDVEGKKGRYFLKFYGLLPDEPISSDKENRTLSMYLTNIYTSLLDIEIKSDDNPLLRANSLATITEVYVESTNSQKTSIIAKIFNSGLISSVFYVGVTDCPLNLPASFSHIYSKPALIPPQHQHVYNLEIQCPLPLNGFVCSLQVLNVKQELIALRKIRLQRKDRCVCAWHCSCACYSADLGLKCKPLSLEAYHVAGFQGGEPAALRVVEYTFWDDMIAMFLYAFVTVCLTLLVMGLVKGVAGICVVPIGLWGLEVVLDLPKKIDRYYERDINRLAVVYDANGWPVHPETGDRVRNIPAHAEFCVNLIFFIVYPFCIVWHLVKKTCTGKVERKDIDVCYCKQGAAVQRKNRSLQNSLIFKSK